MHITAETLDDLLVKTYKRLLAKKQFIAPSRGSCLEITGVLLTLTNPRARLSRTEMRGRIFSALGELLWYLSKSNQLQFIAHYIPRYKDETEDGKTIHGGYGPRLFKNNGVNQIKNVIERLSKNAHSRRAVIQIFTPNDLVGDHKEVPCTCTMQFMIRHSRLLMHTFMRSNDAYLGLPHDIFAFTMLQEIIARSLNVQPGTYKHYVGSLHLYEQNIEDTKKYLDEGFQRTIEMPAMPRGDPWKNINKLLRFESAIRRGRTSVPTMPDEEYWADIARLLQIYAYGKLRRTAEASSVKKRMSTNFYHMYINDRLLRSRQPMKPIGEQLLLDIPKVSDAL